MDGVRSAPVVADSNVAVPIVSVVIVAVLKVVVVVDAGTCIYW